MPTFQFEVGLAVDGYLDQDCGDVEGAFEDCRSDYDGARIEAQGELMDHLTDQELARVRITSVAFLEFDSSNIHHAVGYFEVHCDAPQDVIDALTGEDKLLGIEED